MNEKQAQKLKNKHISNQPTEDFRTLQKILKIKATNSTIIQAHWYNHSNTNTLKYIEIYVLFFKLEDAKRTHVM
jgi:hypothetical protein